ncbi:little elongation complex subunit 1 [Polymixia lowei]
MQNKYNPFGHFAGAPTMMPGENLSKSARIAADATVGACHNCTVLHENLEEYVTSFLTLKQKITDSDHLLSEYQDNEAIRLQGQLGELEAKLVSLEKQNADYESVRAELEENKNSLRAFGQMSNEMERLKEENNKTITQNKKIEDHLKDMEESNHKQSLQISQLTKEKILLERNIHDLQVRLRRLERERTKEFMSASTQVHAPEEPKVDKEKVRRLLEDLWSCMEPQTNRLQLPEASYKQVCPSSLGNGLHPQLAKSDRSQSASHIVHEPHHCTMQSQTTFSSLRPTPPVLQATKCQASPLQTVGKIQTNVTHKRRSKELIKQKSSTVVGNKFGNLENESHNEKNGHSITINEILEWFKPLPSCISPMLELDKEVGPLESKDGKMENPLKSTNDSLLLQQRDSLLIATPESNHHPNSTELQTDQTMDSPAKTEQNLKSSHYEETMDSPVVTTQVMEHICNGSDSKPFEQHELTGLTATQGKRNDTDNGETENQENMQIDQLPENAQSSSPSSSSDIFILVEISSLTLESEAPPCSTGPSSSLSVETGIRTSLLSHTEDTSGVSEAGEDKPAAVAKMDAAAGTRIVISSDDMTRDGGELPRGSSDTVDSESASEAQPITFTTLSGSMPGINVMKVENNVEAEEASQDSRDFGGGKSKTTEAACKSTEADVKESLSEDTNEPEGRAFLSAVASVSNSISGVFDKKGEDGNENELSVKPGEANRDETHETETIAGAASPIKLNGGIAAGMLSPQKSPVLTMADAEKESLTDQKSSNANDNASTKEETLNRAVRAEDNGASLAHLQETIKTVSCESTKESIHTVCRQVSPLCVLPSVEVQSLKSDTEPDMKNVDTSKTESEHLNTDIKSPVPVPKSTKGVLEKPILKELPMETIDSSDMRLSRSCISPTVSQDTSLKQTPASTNGPNKLVESCAVMLKTPDVTGEGASLTSPAAGSPAKTSTTTQQVESIRHVRSEMGPPLPPLLAPLCATPPKMAKPINPRHAIGKLSFPSPMDRLASPTTPVQSHMACNSLQHNSPSLNSPPPPNGVRSSPLLFGSATPKHAVPVPGRLPSSALNSSSSSSSSPSQENSMRMLDTMYPELSARARTLSILRGNVGLGGESGTTPTTTVSQISGFKTINSSSTAFTKTELRGEKRPGGSLPQPKSTKWLRVDSCSQSLSLKAMSPSTPASPDGTASPQALSPELLKDETTSQSLGRGKPVGRELIDSSLEKIGSRCFDLLPVIKSHQFVGNMSKKPVLRDEEKEVIAEFCQSSWHIADDMISAILTKLKKEGGTLGGDHTQALCRVYTGLCRQQRDWERAHILAYSILREDIPGAAKLILFMVTTWPNVLSQGSLLCQAIHAVTKLKAQVDVLNCLSAYLGWEKSPPCDIDQVISRTLSEIRTGSSLSFIKHNRYGNDLGTEAWEHVFTLDLLCTHKKWRWTYDNVLGKELWPLMNTWVTQPREQQTPVSDATVATVLRLIGRLSHQGIKEHCDSSVMTVANVINTFGRHGQAEGVPWEVQLAAIYCIYDLSPSNPQQALDALSEWRRETTQTVPPAVTNCINQIVSVCRQGQS